MTWSKKIFAPQGIIVGLLFLTLGWMVYHFEKKLRSPEITGLSPYIEGEADKIKYTQKVAAQLDDNFFKDELPELERRRWEWEGREGDRPQTKQGLGMSGYVDPSSGAGGRGPPGGGGRDQGGPPMGMMGGPPSTMNGNPQHQQQMMQMHMHMQQMQQQMQVIQQQMPAGSGQAGGGMQSGGGATAITPRGPGPGGGVMVTGGGQQPPQNQPQPQADLMEGILM